MTTRQRLVVLLGVALAGLVLSSCKARRPQDASDVKVAGGTFLGERPGSAVRCLKIAELDDSCCSGTFVNPTTYLTAAHCVQTKDKVAFTITVDGHKPAQAFALPSFFDDWQAGNYDSARDLALVVFSTPVGTTLGITRYPPVSPTAPAAGDAVAFQGYGLTDVRDPNSGGKQYWGKNTIAEVSNGVIRLRDGVHWGGATASDAAPLSGDSGGPLTNGSAQLIGVASTSRLAGARGESYFTDLTSPQSRSFFRRLIGDCGFPPCPANFPGSGVSP